MSPSTRVRLIAAATLVAAAPLAHHALAAQAPKIKSVVTSVVIPPVSNLVSASAFTRLNLKDLNTGITYIYFITTLTTQTNMPYQIQAKLSATYAYPPVEARLWNGTGTYVAITTTTSQIVAKGNPRSPQTDEVRFRVVLAAGKTTSTMPAPTITYVIIPQ